MDGKSRAGEGTSDVVTVAELEELAIRMVDIWIGELQRAGDLRSDVTVQEVEDFKTTVVDSILGSFKTIDGFQERLKTGTKVQVLEIIGRYLQAIS
jgi:hypothetical protein